MIPANPHPQGLGNTENMLRVRRLELLSEMKYVWLPPATALHRCEFAFLCASDSRPLSAVRSR